MNIGTTIKNARRKLNMTQEQLAEYLNVSISAVSQWESDKTSPDITIIPSICNLLDISADELLGINILKKQEQIGEIKKEADKFSEIGNHKEAIKILREGLIHFPNSFELMSYLLHGLYVVYMNDGVTESSRNEIIALGEKILAECNVDNIRHSAIQTLCYVYPEDKAVKLAETMPNNFLTCNALLSNIYTEGDKCYTRRRYNVVLSILDAIQELIKMNVKLDNGKFALTIEEDLAICKKALSLMEILCENQDYGEYTLDIVKVQFKMTMLLCKKGNADEAIEIFDKIVSEVISFDTDYDRTKKHTSILLYGDDYGGFEFSNTENLSCGISRLAESKEELNLIKGDKRFISSLDKLKSYASKGRNFDNYRP